MTKHRHALVVRVEIVFLNTLQAQVRLMGTSFTVVLIAGHWSTEKGTLCAVI